MCNKSLCILQTRKNFPKKHLTAGELNKSCKWFEACPWTASKKDPCFSLRHFNWLWTNYVIPSQVATADGLIQRPVSIWSQGGLLLGMDATLLGSLPAWVSPCLLLLLGINRVNKVARFQAGVKDAVKTEEMLQCYHRRGFGGTHSVHVVTAQTHTTNGATHLGQSLRKDWWKWLVGTEDWLTFIFTQRVAIMRERL